MLRRRVVADCCSAMPLVLMLAGTCVAQSPPTPQIVEPKACSNEQRLRLGPSNSPTDPSHQSLSEKLDRTEGVICPPDVDPEMKAPAPEVGKTPVIPPPGSPGGDPNVRPK
jgi:hypothetical protein